MPASDTQQDDPGPSEVQDAAGSLQVPAVLFFLSGFAGLTYEVLWQRELGILFGNTTQATATTLAVFFLGLAAGSWILGRRSSLWKRPLRAFGWLEIGTAIGAALLFVLLPLYRAVFSPLYGALGSAPGAFLLVKFLLAVLVLGLPSFLMGGTLPALGELAARRGRGFARGGVLLYGLNTAGAVVGAFAAGFFLPRVLGYRGAYLAAMIVSLLVGMVALARARRISPPARAVSEAAPARGGTGLIALAALSGFGALALQVLWTRMVALSFQNSIYTFAAVVGVFLAALALGAAIARRLCRSRRDPAALLWALLFLSAIWIFVSPLIFRSVVGEPGAIGQGDAWRVYVLKNLGVLAAAIVPAAISLGTIFPFLLRMEELRGGGAQGAGARIGRLLAANTVGALLGAVAGGFVLPETLGLWVSVSALAGLYFLAAAIKTPGSLDVSPAGLRLLCILLAAGSVGVAIAGDKRARAWNVRTGEKVLAVYEGAAGTVIVVDREGDLKLRLNNSYTLGGTAEPHWEHYQAHIPLCLHPNPKRAFFLGMGTGITAGAALHHDLHRVRVAEIVPEAVTATRDHFSPWVNGLFEDKRVDIVVEDGRTVLLGSEERYDVIVGDLFLPWKRGTSLLYTREQFEAVRARLAPGGVYAQWLPLYQLSEAEFFGTARTFWEVFPNATLWRGDFFPERPIVALVGRATDAPLDGAAISKAWQRLTEDDAVDLGSSYASLPFMLYAGRLEGAKDLLRQQPLITDDRPWIEFTSPISQRAREALTARAFVGKSLAKFERALLRARPPEKDPALRGWSRSQRRYAMGGMFLYEYKVTGPYDGDARSEALAGLIRSVPERVRPPPELWIE